ncbi:MAG: hypothetical protein AAEJ52_18265 [Myxococcota bacterium]
MAQADLEDRLQPATAAYALFRERGSWFWVAVAMGFAVRAYLILLTPGTDDVPIWESHAGWTAQNGLIGYYSFQEVFNHPPFIGRVLSELWQLAKAGDIPYRIPHRAIFSLFDLGNALLLLRLFRESPWKYAIFAGYWLNPLAVIFSSYHGNTDTAVAFFVLLAMSFAVERRAALAGVAIGVGLWFKLPTVLAIPALFFFFEGAAASMVFGCVALAVGATTYLTTALQAWDLLYVRVLAYPGLDIVTPGGVPVWGFWNVFGIVKTAPESARTALEALIGFHRDHNSLVSVLPIGVYAFLRRNAIEPRELGVTICGSFLIFYGLTNFWAYQYLAWVLPFLIFPGAVFSVAATVVLFAYIYSLYTMLCGNPYLLGKWDFNAYPFWPTYMLRLRDFAILFCLLSGATFLYRAARQEWARLRAGSG